jgi:hypothetical protein
MRACARESKGALRERASELACARNVASCVRSNGQGKYLRLLLLRPHEKRIQTERTLLATDNFYFRRAKQCLLRATEMTKKNASQNEFSFA